MTVASTGYLSGLLKRTGLFSEDRISAVLDAARSREATITDIVVRDGYAKEDEFLQAMARVLNIPFVRLNSKPEQEVLDRLPTRAVFQYHAIPISFENGSLLVASNDPLNAGMVDALRLAVGTRVRLALSTSDDIAKAENRFYGVGADTIDRIKKDRFEEEVGEDFSRIDVSEMGQEASIVKFVNQIIAEADKQGATDIHFEPMEDKLRVRYRIDGVLHETVVPPQLNLFKAAIISRIKVMANLDIAEKRLPMDGRIGWKDVDIRVSTMPTVYGESVSLRLLQKKEDFVGLKELGMNQGDSESIQKIIRYPNGIVLVTGPTGSGKSTSLYAYLHEINDPGVRIMTAEEPIEYEMEGINQVLVRPEIDLTFARILRSFLRQDPDIIMVGEIRDRPTADIAIQASLTGHLVFSTLHTNDAASAFTRLLDIGVEPYLLASAVEAVVAQRLVRRLCKSCKRPVEVDAAMLQELREKDFPVERLDNVLICDADGCEECNMTGFRGRCGIFEVLKVSDAVESLIIVNSAANEIKQRAITEGMRTLRDDGWIKVLDGVTTVKEVFRVSEENE